MAKKNQPFKLSESKTSQKEEEEDEPSESETPETSTAEPPALQKKLNILGPRDPSLQSKVLTFVHSTKAQERTQKRQQPIKLEPLPVLKTFQDHKQPEYIYQKNREKLLSSGLLQPAPRPLERIPTSESVSSAVSVDSKRKQTQLLTSERHSPSPPKQQRISSGRMIFRKKISATYPTLTFQNREDVIRANITDPLQIIKIINENKHLGFLYMIPAVPTSSIEYDPYNLRIIIQRKKL